jgi:hypothetical protein
VPEAVKRRRNRELLDLQLQISAQVHAEYIGRSVDVFVEQVSRREPAALPSEHDHGRVELRWEQQAASESKIQNTGGAKSKIPREGTTQLSGRTEGDLIAVFDLPPDPPGSLPGNLTGNLTADDLLGRIVPIQVQSSGPLILKGVLKGSPLPQVEDPPRRGEVRVRVTAGRSTNSEDLGLEA